MISVNDEHVICKFMIFFEKQHYNVAFETSCIELSVLNNNYIPLRKHTIQLSQNPKISITFGAHLSHGIGLKLCWKSSHSERLLACRSYEMSRNDLVRNVLLNIIVQLMEITIRDKL